MNCGLKSGGRKYSPYRRIYREAIVSPSLRPNFCCPFENTSTLCRYHRWILSFPPWAPRISSYTGHSRKFRRSCFVLVATSLFVLCPTPHLFATLVNWTLRHFDLSLSGHGFPRTLLENQTFLATCAEYPRTVWCIWTPHNRRTCSSLRNQVQRRFRLCHDPVFFGSLMHPFRHLFSAVGQAGILSAASRADKADVEQMKKIVRLNTCEIAFWQYVCELVFGVNILNLNPRIQIDSVK